MIDIVEKSLKGYRFIDLFAGIGAFRLALESFGAKCVYSSEWDKHAADTYNENFKDYPDGDITQVDERDIPDHDILCAGFPCQAFSISGNMLGFEDSRGTLFFDVARIVKEKRPKVVLMENVRNFAKHDNGNTLKVVEKTMRDLGYSFHYDVLAANDYGIPQKRERIYMVCFRKDIDDTGFKFPEPVELKYYLDDILLPDNETNHLVVKRNDFKYTNVNDPTTKQNKTIRLGIVGKGGQGERVYSPNGVAITISSTGGGVFAKTGGYLINGKLRRLHPREVARLMGFPDSYKLNSSNNQAYKQLGNSVVVNVLQYIVIQIIDVLKCEL